MNSLKTILQSQRKKNFIGRDREISQFEKIIKDPFPEHVMIYIQGPGGQGKSSLLFLFSDKCEENGIPYFYVDGRNVDTSPQTFLEALALVSPFNGLDVNRDILNYKERVVLFFDSYEKMMELDYWLRNQFFPKLPANVIIVMAGRNELSSDWKMDASWKHIIYNITLNELNKEESGELLRKRNMPDRYISSIVESTHGNALALSIVADTFDQNNWDQYNHIYSPDIVKKLLEQFIEDMPDYDQRTVLELCCLVHTTTEKLIELIYGKEKAHDLFSWLDNLSFISKSLYGLHPHEIVREVIISELQWRNRSKFYFLLDKVLVIYIDRLKKKQGFDQQRLLFAITYLHRFDLPIMQFFRFQGMTNARQDKLKTEDIPVILEAVKKHEGAASAKCFEKWLNHPASHIWVFREFNEKMVGFFLKINVEKLSGNTHDPAINSIIKYIQDKDLKPGQQCMVIRNWMTIDNYQNVDHNQSAIFLAITQSYSNPDLAISLGCFSEPLRFKEFFEYIKFDQVKQLDFELEGKPYGFFEHDWRKVNMWQWLRAINSNREGVQTDDIYNPLNESVPALISEEEFYRAVTEVLKNLDQPKKLVANPLLKSCFIKQQGIEDLSDISLAINLCEIISTRIKKLENSIKHQQYYRLLYRTFVNPVGSQLETADFLCMSFSTYRRQIKKAVDWFSDQIWVEENQLRNSMGAPKYQD